MEKEDILRETIDRMLEFYRVSINGEPFVKERNQQMVEKEQKFCEALQEKDSELSEMYDEVMTEKAEKEIEEQRYIYMQAVTDTVKILKMMGIL